MLNLTLKSDRSSLIFHCREKDAQLVDWLVLLSLASRRRWRHAAGRPAFRLRIQEKGKTSGINTSPNLRNFGRIRDKIA